MQHLVVTSEPICDSPESKTLPEQFWSISQEPVLCLVLFLIYVNDLISAVKNTKPVACFKLCHPDVRSCSNTTSNEDFLVAFADDTTVVTLGKTECDIKSNLVAIFERVISWFDANFLALNVGNSHFLIFSRIGIDFPQLTHFQVSQGSLCRPVNRVFQLLGILLDENFSFRNHIVMIRVSPDL